MQTYLAVGVSYMDIAMQKEPGADDRQSQDNTKVPAQGSAQAQKQAKTLDKRKALGKNGEDEGAAWLVANGMRILERNYRCRIGEIDIIGEMDGVLVVVEVRGRSNERWGLPTESVGAKKRHKLRLVATHYLCQSGRIGQVCRFDVLGLLYGPSGDVVRFDWVANAF